MEFIAVNPATDIVFGPGPGTMEHCVEGKTRYELRPTPRLHDLWILLARWYLPQTGAPLWGKQAIVDVGGWKPDQPCCQENELYLRLLMAGKRFTYCEHNGAIYRYWGENTLWRGNVPEVHRRRLEIEQRAEDFLRSTNALTPERRYAINMTRFEIARIAWRYNPNFASEIVRHVQMQQPEFIPTGAAAPSHYRIVYRLFGFSAAQRLASFGRIFKTAGVNSALNVRGTDRTEVLSGLHSAQTAQSEKYPK